jgi:UDP-glucose 4-epimerase
MEEANGKIYNLGGTEIISLKDLARLVVEVNGSGDHRVVPFPEDRKKIDIGDYYSDDSRIRAELGWVPRVSVREAIERTISYYRENLEHYL